MTTFSRRDVIRTGIGITAMAFSAPALAQGTGERPPFLNPALPFEDDALEPVISARTIGFHYGKHQAGYFARLNKAVADTEMAEMRLEDVVRAAAGDPALTSLYQDAAQAWNHVFYWEGMIPGSAGPDGALKEAIERDFDDMAGLKAAMLDAGGVFGTGWAWLVRKPDGRLATVGTEDADNPLNSQDTPLLTLDLWEHAYYLDWQNKRKAHLEAVLDKLVNWRVVSERMTL